jgi:1D-myo-inositol 3-kinase
VTRDLLPSGRSRAGGTALFSSLTARAHGLRSTVITSFADNDAIPELEGSSLRKIPSQETTTFRNDYFGALRAQQVTAIAERLPADVLEGRGSSQAILHLGPVIDEIDEGIFSMIADQRWGFIGVTPQGWMRELRNERAHARPWRSAELAANVADAVVFSDEDVGGRRSVADELAARFRICAITCGEHGCRLFVAGQESARVPAPRVSEVDPTGAGDIFAACFFIGLAQGCCSKTAARYATQLATESVARDGLAGIPSPETVAQCGSIGRDDVPHTRLDRLR